MTKQTKLIVGVGVIAVLGVIVYNQNNKNFNGFADGCDCERQKERCLQNSWNLLSAINCGVKHKKMSCTL